jgi:hypothetical protein
MLLSFRRVQSHPRGDGTFDPSINLSTKAKLLSPLDQAWVMSVTNSEQKHWLDTDSWDLNKV